MLMDRRKTLWRIGAGAAALALAPGARGAESKDPLPRTRDYVVALVRSHPDVDAKTRPVQKIEPVIAKPDPGSAPDNALVFDHFVGDLHLRYVFDDPQFMLALRVRDLKRLAIDRAESCTAAARARRRAAITERTTATAIHSAASAMVARLTPDSPLIVPAPASCASHRMQVRRR